MMRFIITLIMSLLFLSFAYSLSVDRAELGENYKDYIKDTNINETDMRNLGNIQGRIDLFNKLIDSQIRRIDLTIKRVEEIKNTQGKEEALNELKEKRQMLVDLQEEMKGIKTDEEFAQKIKDFEEKLKGSKKDLVANKGQIASNKLSNAVEVFNKSITKLEEKLNGRYNEELDLIKAQYKIAIDKIESAKSKFELAKSSEDSIKQIKDAHKDMKDAHIELRKTRDMLLDLMKKLRADAKKSRNIITDSNTDANMGESK